MHSLHSSDVATGTACHHAFTSITPLPPTSEPRSGSVTGKTPESPSFRSLPRNFSWIFVGTAVYAAAQWGMLVVLARLGSPEAVGQFALALAVAAPVMLLANLSLRTVQAVDARDRYAFSEYFTLRLLTSAGAVIAIALLAVIAGYDRTVVFVLVIVGVSKAINSMADIVFGLFQRHQEMDHIGISLILNAGSSIIGLGVAFSITGSVVWAAAGLAIASAFTFLIHNLPASAQLMTRKSASLPAMHETRANGMEPRQTAKRLWGLAMLATPLGVSAMLASLAVNVPRYVIEHHHGEAALGVFAALAYVIVAVNTLVGALAQAAMPPLSQYYEDCDGHRYWQLVRRTLSIGVVVGGMMIGLAHLAGAELLALIYGPRYAGHTSLFTWLAIAGAVGCIGWSLEAALAAARAFKLQLFSNGTFFAIAVLGSLAIIPTHGVIGTAWVLVASAIGQNVTRAGALVWIARPLRAA